MNPGERNQKTLGGYARTQEGVQHRDGPSFDDLLKQAEEKGMTPELKQTMVGRLAGLQRNISQMGQVGADIIANAPVPGREENKIDPAQAAQEERIKALGQTLLGYKVDVTKNPITLDTLEQAVTARVNQSERMR